ncbi:MAG: peptidylprolyl isomerase [Clostridia bacterium]|nr:peptidylprolyl isomerase [Clostridia bacterium]
MGKNKKAKSSKKKIIIISCVALVAVLAAVVIVLAVLPKSYGIYTLFGKMKADYILDLTVDVGYGETTYRVPFKEYRAVYLHYKYLLDKYSYIPGDEENTGSFITDGEKNTALKEYVENVFVSYYSLVDFANRHGLGITDDDRAAYAADHKRNLDTLKAELDASGVKYKSLEAEYEERLKTSGLAPMDFLEFNYFNNILTRRVKAYYGAGLDETINENYFGYRSIYLSFTMGDTAAEAKAYKAAEEALAELDAGNDFDSVAQKYTSEEYKGTVYFDSNGRIVEINSHDELDRTVSDMIKALSYGEYSGIMSGEETIGQTDDSAKLGYYMIVCRDEVTSDFVFSDSPIASVMFMYPYFGASSLTPYYTQYTEAMDNYEQNMRVVPVDENVYSRIAINTLY